MRITVPEVDDIKFKQKPEEVVPSSFEQEIKEILTPPTLTSKYVVDQQGRTSSDFNLLVLLKFIQLCREEIIPQHIKAFEIIQAKKDMIQCQLNTDMRRLADLKQQQEVLEEATQQLQVKRQLVLNNHQALKERVEETFKKLQDYCKTRTLAEKKMVLELENLGQRVEKLKLDKLDASAKWEYLNAQVYAQTRMVEKRSAHGYLEKNRVVFLRTNLNYMLHNIEELVRRTKYLKEKTAELTEFECSTEPGELTMFKCSKELSDMQYLKK